MYVGKPAEDEILPQVGDNQMAVKGAIVPTELATTIFTNGLVLQFRQGIAVPE